MVEDNVLLGRRTTTQGPLMEYYLDPMRSARRELRQHADEQELQGNPNYNGVINRVFEDHVMARMAENPSTYKKSNLYYDTPGDVERRDREVVQSVRIKPPLSKMPGEQKLTKKGLTQQQAAENNRKKQLRLNRARQRRGPQQRGRGRGGYASFGARKTRERKVREPMYEPFSYARNRKSGMIVTFRAGRRPGCMRMNFKLKICQIGVANIAGVGNTLGFINLGGTGPVSGHSSGILPVSPNMVYYFPTQICQLVNMFTYYYVNRAGLTVQPRVNVQNSAVCTLAYSGDIEYLETHQLTSGGTPSNARPTEGGLSGLSNSCTEVLYKSCAIGANDVDKERKYFTTTTATFDNADLNFLGQNPSSLRQGIAGVFMIAGVKNGSDANDTAYADVYLDMDIELCEFSPPVTADADFLSVRHAEEQKSELDFDVRSAKSDSRKSTGNRSLKMCN